MTEQTIKTFLNKLIKAYPGFKTRIIDPKTFVSNWMSSYGDRTEEDMMEAAQIYIDRGNRFFPTPDEFKMSLILVASRKTQREQAEYERTHPTSAEDQAKIDFIIQDIFGG